MTTSEIQIGQGCQHMDLAAVLGQATQPGLLKAELLLDHPERMLNLGADMSFGGLDQWSLPSGVSGKLRRLPGRIATLNSAFVPSIAGLLVMPW